MLEETHIGIETVLSLSHQILHRIGFFTNEAIWLSRFNWRLHYSRHEAAQVAPYDSTTLAITKTHAIRAGRLTLKFYSLCPIEPETVCISCRSFRWHRRKWIYYHRDENDRNV